MSGPSSVRFDPVVRERMNSFLAAHSGMSLSSASNLLVDEALRSHEHPLVIFRDGPAGRRARLVGGPDVWEVVRAVRSARTTEPKLSPTKIVSLVSDTSSVPASLVLAAIAYWTAFPDEIDARIDQNDREAAAARQRWQREQALLGA